jgi:hypothetical protein
MLYIRKIIQNMKHTRHMLTSQCCVPTEQTLLNQVLDQRCVHKSNEAGYPLVQHPLSNFVFFYSMNRFMQFVPSPHIHLRLLPPTTFSVSPNWLKKRESQRLKDGEIARYEVWGGCGRIVVRFSSLSYFNATLRAG